MKFTDGLWLKKSGTSLHRAHDMWRYRIEGDEIEVLVPCREIRGMHDTTEGSCLTFRFSAPRTDMISVKVLHYAGRIKRGPYFGLDLDKPAVDIVDSEDTITMTSGKLQAVLCKKGNFGYHFYYDGKPLTWAGNRGTAYVTDVDYEADQRCDYNANPPYPYRKETYVREALSLDVGEYIYGFGEHFTPIVKNGQSIDIWNRDGGSASDQAYKNVPFYLSNKGYGVFVNTPDRVEFEVGSASVRNVEFSVEGEELEYIVIGGGSPKKVLSYYTALTGRTPVPPAWSFGLWLSTSWEPDSSAEITMDFVNGMADRDIPLSVFHFDARWMDDFNCCDFIWADRFGDAPEMLRKIHEKGVKVCCWINPYVAQQSRLFAEGAENGYFIKRQDGSVWQSDNWMAGMAVVDFTNPAACKWYADRLGEIIDMGVDCIKTDFGERIPTDVIYFDGSDPRKMHNYYPYLYNKTIFGMLEEKRGKGEAIVFSRSSTTGTQQFPVNWGGDNEATYISMAESLRGGLSFCQSGFGYWAHDISGFVGTATPDLYKRWTAFGMLSTHSRLHGMSSYRVPWCFDEEACEVLSFFTKLKCSLMPYLFAGAVNVNLAGEPLMRAMMLEFPEDQTCLMLDRQYMLGDSLLVAPIFREDGVVEFYVPEGVWTNYINGEQFEGGKWYTRKYDYFNLPLLVRAGAVIARGSVNAKPDYDYADGITYEVFSLADGQKGGCTVYDTACAEAVKMEIVRSGNQMSVSVSGRDAGKPWAVQLRGVDGVQKIAHGTAEACKNGVCIRAAGDTVIITL